MPPRTARRTLVSLAATATVLAATVAAPAQAHLPARQSAPAAAPAPRSGAVAAIADRLAHQLAVSLPDRGLRERILPAALDGPVDLVRATAGTPLADAVRVANRDLLAAKGLPAADVSILRLRLAHPDLRAGILRGQEPLVAARADDDTTTGVTAYGAAGASVHLDGRRLPAQPVLLVEVDTATALSMGLEVVRAALARSGITGASAGADGVTAAAGYWATKVNAIRLANDQEPWIKGAAEIFAVVGGFGLDGKVKIDTVQLPYLDHDGTTYFPNQLLVHFSAYKYNLADVVMMEDDGDTNYLQLAQAIATALLTIVDGGTYVPLVNAILGAMPTSWWTDDPDYVDSWYTLSTRSSGRLNGAAANGWMDVVPYFVEQL